MPPVLVVHDGRIVVTASIDARWAGWPQLVGGVPLVLDPSCTGNDGDYETDQRRFWACEGSSPGAYQRFVVTAALHDAPGALTSWIGRRVRLGGVGAGCVTTVASLEVRAEREATYDRVTTRYTDGDAIARAVLRTGEPVVVAKPASPCDARWATLADAPVIEWPLAAAPARVAGALRATLPGGWPELVFENGVAVYVAAREHDELVRLVRCPDEVANCGD